MLALLGGIVVGLSIVASDNRPVVMPFDPMDRMTESSTSFLAVNVHIGHYAPDIEIPIAVGSRHNRENVGVIDKVIKHCIECNVLLRAENIRVTDGAQRYRESKVVEFALLKDRGPSPVSHVVCGCLPFVYKDGPDLEPYTLFALLEHSAADHDGEVSAELLTRGALRDLVGLQGRPYGHPGGFYRLVSEQQSVDEGRSSNKGEGQLRPCRYYLIFGGCGASLGSYSGSLLGLQIVGLLLVGFLFAILGVLGLFWSLNDRYRDRKAVGFALAAACLPACLFFYAWGLYGHPGAIIGLGMGR